MTEGAAPDRVVPAMDEELRGRVRLGLVRAEPVAVAPTGPELEAAIRGAADTLTTRHAGRSPSDIAGLTPARELYRAFGIDPTRTRPSSEALLRRVLQGKPFPRISNAVDLCNLCALLFLLPIGLYDRTKIDGPVTLRRGGEGESYPGIRKDDVHLTGRPVLSDRTGPFGNPTSDSARTAIRDTTRSIWMVIFAPASYPPDRLSTHVREACDLAGAPSGATGRAARDGRFPPPRRLTGGRHPRGGDLCP